MVKISLRTVGAAARARLCPCALQLVGHCVPSALPQEACLQGNLIAICLEQLSDPHPLLRQWVAICLGRIWQNFDSARWCGVRDSAHEKLCSLLSDPIPEVSRPRPVAPSRVQAPRGGAAPGAGAPAACSGLAPVSALGARAGYGEGL